MRKENLGNDCVVYKAFNFLSFESKSDAHKVKVHKRSSKHQIDAKKTAITTVHNSAPSQNHNGIQDGTMLA